MGRLNKFLVDLRIYMVFLILGTCVHISKADESNEGSSIFHPKAEGSSGESKDGFASSIWGAYLFSLIGIGAFVLIVGFLLHYLTGERRPKSPKARTSLNNPNYNFQPQYEPQDTPLRNELYLDSRQLQQPPKPTSPLRREPPPPSFQTFASPTVTELTSPSMYDNQYNYPNQTLYPASTEFKMEPYVLNAPPPPKYEKLPESKSEPETNGPFKYLEKYEPYTTQSTTLTEEEHIIPKRAVLRAITPYKIVKDKVKDTHEADGGNGNGGEGAVDPTIDSYNYNNDGSYNYNSNFNYQNNAFDSYPEETQSMYPKLATNNEGMIDSRFVRVLPRYPSAPSPKPSGQTTPTVGFNI